MGCMLCVHILDSFKTFEDVPAFGKDRLGGEEIVLALFGPCNIEDGVYQLFRESAPFTEDSRNLQTLASSRVRPCSSNVRTRGSMFED
jgi:hypothetical protein